MCGIIGFTGNLQAPGILVDGLQQLEYRGYDSAGIAVNNGSETKIDVYKRHSMHLILSGFHCSMLQLCIRISVRSLLLSYRCILLYLQILQLRS